MSPADELDGVASRDPSVVDCIDLMDEITDYLDGATSTARRAAIDEHLLECSECLAAIEQFRRVVEISGSLRSHDVGDLDPVVRVRLLGVFRSV